MAHGKPDWNRTAGPATTYQLDDLGEEAARLGSIVTFDRRGDIIWLDDFENTLNKWEDTLGGTGAAAAISTVRMRNGGNSALLTGGSDGTGQSEIIHRSPFTVASRVGMESSFHTDGEIDYLQMQIITRDGTDQVTYNVRFDDAGQILSYLNSGGTRTTIVSSFQVENLATLFNTWKLVVDQTTGEYVRLIINNTEHDLSGNGGFGASSALEAHVQIDLFLHSRSGQNDTAYIDDVILTQNEP